MKTMILHIARIMPRSFMAFSLLLVLFTTGCATSTSPAGGNGGPVPEKVVIGLGDDVTYFSSVTLTGGNGNYLSRNVYESLVKIDTNFQAIPGIASSWKLSSDGKSYEFKLRKGATFVNGDPITVEDVAFAFANSRDPKINLGLAGEPYKRWMEVVDNETVRYDLEIPDVGFLRGLAGSFINHVIPQKYYDSVGGEAGFEKAPVGSGPYKVTDRRIKEGWTLERYDGYWGDKPQVRTAVFKVIPEPSTRVAALKVGEIDFVANFPPASKEQMETTPGFKVIKNAASNTISIRINKLRKTDPATGVPNPFLDKRVRQAMSYSIDRDAIINKLLHGIAEPMAVLFPEDFGYDPELKPYPYDPNKAKQLLAQAGYPNGFDATFYGLLGERIPLSQEVGEAVANYMTSVGIRIKLVGEEYAAWLARTTRNTSEGKPNELYPLGYGMTTQAGSVNPYTGWRQQSCASTGNQWNCDPDLDKTIELLRNEGDPKKSEAIVKELSRKFHEQQYTIILYRNVVLYAYKDRIEFTPTAQSQYVELRNLRWK